MKRISLLGSTGSIGVNVLNVVNAHPDRYRIVALGAGGNLDLLEEQIHSFHPRAVAVREESAARRLKERLTGPDKPQVFFATEGLVRLATYPEADTVVSAITGAAGLVPTHAAVSSGRHVALANKETMVLAGPLIMEEARRRDVSVLPIDSEHSAVLQSLQGHAREDVKRVILTASGGPFREMPLEEMKRITPDQALRHPNWSMGPKVTIDSATLMNKGLEAIEARWFFGLRMEQISVLVHPQSIVHSMVEYIDGSIIAQLGVPDMMTPISYALSYPRHLETPLPPLDLETVGTLSFEKPDQDRFPCLGLAWEAARIGGTMPTGLNGANEIAVASFLEGRIGFQDIPRLIEKTMARHEPTPANDIEAIMEADAWARSTAREILAGPARR